jgi:hypothetical protein
VGLLFHKITVLISIHRSNNTTVTGHKLTLEDFDVGEVKQDCKPIFLDPGRKAIFTAVEELEGEAHSILRSQGVLLLNGKYHILTKVAETKERTGDRRNQNWYFNIKNH